MNKSSETFNPHLSLQEQRSLHRVQERPAFRDETQGAFEIRPIATPEKTEEMDQKLLLLSNLLKGAGIRWQLDGAINISLWNGSYIGAHKDVDLFIEPEDLEALEKHLYKKGYGLFLTSHHAQGETKTMTWVSASEFRQAHYGQSLVALDENGNIRFHAPLNFMDVHLVQRDEKRRPLGQSGTPLPSEWYDPQPFVYQGHELFLSHPAKVAYFKLHKGRSYDLTDLLALAKTKVLTLKDVDTLEYVIEQEMRATEQRIIAATSRIAPFLQKDMTKENIMTIFFNDPEVASTIQASEDQKNFGQMIDQFLEQTDMSQESVQRFFLEKFAQKKRISTLRHCVQCLRAGVEEAFAP
jgi:hypothetical protein